LSVNCIPNVDGNGWKYEDKLFGYCWFWDIFNPLYPVNPLLWCNEKLFMLFMLLLLFALIDYARLYSLLLLIVFDILFILL
jgi:hypothetical protein